MTRAPETREEWIEAVSLATLSLALHRGVQKGFIAGIAVDVKRCEWTIEEGRRRGVAVQGMEVKDITMAGGRR